MANSLTGENNDTQNAGAPVDQVTVPTFDPVTPAGRRARLALLLTSLITIICLVAAMVSEHYLKPWRTYQRQYKSLLATKARTAGRTPPSFPQEIKQITSFSYEVADRCTTCHLGIDDPSMADEHQPFRSHPAWVLDVHPIENFGCTPCHGGQGLATTVEDAHGDVPHWEDPLIPAGYYQAGCGSCHSHIKVSGGGLSERGERIFERNDCYACHTIEGRGRGNGPDLSGVGAQSDRSDWHRTHLSLQQQSHDEIWWQSYGPLEAEEILAIDTFLAQLVRAPGLAKAKAVAYGKGCMGCHHINGVGGDDGPDLSNAGRKIAHKLDFTHVSGARNIASWHKAHLTSPADITQDSQMPQLMVTDEELELLTLYLLSLRAEATPINRWPPDRVEAERLGVREFAGDGESLFMAFCSACHGSDGMGGRFGISPLAFPAVAHPEFLAVASDRFIRQTLLDGRPERRMPAWAAKQGGLRLEEVDEIIAYLRSKQPPAPSWESVEASLSDVMLGAEIYRRDCATCHGLEGEGASSPALANPVFQKTVEPRFIYQMLIHGREDTAMGSFRHYDSLQMASLIKYILNWRSGTALALPILPDKTSAVRGQGVFNQSCAPCHGQHGEGNFAVNLVNPALLEDSSDGFMAAAVVHGRCVPPKNSPPDLKAPDISKQELADAITYLRQRISLGPQIPPGRMARGLASTGETLFADTCSGCHGKKGKDGTAPELASPMFLAAATDGYLQATIARGRPSAGMPAFGTDNAGHRRLDVQEIDDIVRYLRTMEPDS
jgi:mono/diheme cytochrome c family protein